MTTTTETQPTTVEVSPSEITRNVKPGEMYAETVTVRNLDKERSSFLVKAEGEYRSWVDPDPNLFAIDGEEERVVTLELRPPRGAKIGVHRFKTRVINDDKEDDQAEVDVTLKVPFDWRIIIAIVVIVIIVLVVLWMLRSVG